MNNEQIIRRLSARTRAVLLTHILGYNALSQPLLDELERRGIPLLEDGCESHGATFAGRKIGTFGLASNFSFYYAHHLSTIEGGMVCTNDEAFYETVRMLRSHGLVRELDSRSRKERYYEAYPELNREFIFAFPAYNVRSTEINAIIGRSQLRRLDANVEQRTENLRLFLDNLDPEIYQTDFELEGSSNYAFTLLLRRPDSSLCRRVMAALQANHIEFRRGTSGGGNQLRQPYLRRLLGPDAWKQCPRADHVHFYGFYIGNYPTLESEKILRLCELLNSLAPHGSEP
jgi:CDP-6-deoxy-D-xylo-4-hexulose-3-dehydrase